jgi:uncharacterized membrane protein YfcA
MSYVVICTVGLGTLLLPAFALFVPVEHAVALTAVVHLLNSLFKLALTGRHIDRSVVVRFGVPAIAMAFLGAWVLAWLSGIAPALSWSAFGRTASVMPVKLVVGVLLLLFASLELLPRFRDLSFDARYLPLGGLLSGFFGGLSGMQGALRSAFLSRAGLTKESFIATGVAIACLIDFSRLAIYSTALARGSAHFDYGLLAAAVLAAFAGAALGNYHLEKTTLPGIQRLVAAMLFAVALGLVTGIL